MPAIGTSGVVELRRIVGQIDDIKAAIILSLNPTIEEVEEAVAWAEGRGDALGNGPWPLTGKVGEIFEILTAEDEEERHD
jgi:hypothetical protein